MTVVQCAVRRLASSLLQRTKAPVAEEGRRLVPNRFMRPHQLSTKQACETWMEKKMQKLRSLWAQHKADIERGMREPVEEDEFKLLVESYARSIDRLIHGAVGLLFVSSLPCAVFVHYRDKWKESRAVTKENQ